MMADEFYVGQIIQFSGKLEISGLMFCDGRSLSISNYQALFSIIGNQFGGDGIKTFNLPKIEAVNGVRSLIAFEGLYPQERY